MVEHVGYCSVRLPKILKWPGGKHFQVKELCKLIPKHKTYVEPFAGGASLFFSKKPSEVEVLSDIDCDLIEFYKTIRELESLDEITKYGWAQSRDTWERLRECVEADECNLDNPTYHAYAFLYVNKYGYGGKAGRRSFNPSAGSGRKCTEEQLCGIKNLYRKWDDIRKRLNQAQLECADFREVLEEWDSPDTFFYLDPPYLGPILEGRSEELYEESAILPEEMNDILKGLQGKWLLSYDDHPRVRRTFESFKIHEIPYRQQMGEKKPKVDLAITNYEIEHV